MKPKNKSLHDKPVQKVTLEDGQQLTGKVIGYKNMDGDKINLLLDSGRELSLVSIKSNREVLKLKRGEYVTVKEHKQSLKIEPVQSQTMKLKREM